MTTMDHRFVERRRVVREHGARRRLRWTLMLLALASLVGFGIWLTQSPLLSLDYINISGAVRASVADRLDGAGISVGKPLVAVRAGLVEAAVAADPWVAGAEVQVVWPDTLEVAVIEREPAAWLAQPSGWALVATDGVVVASSPAGGTAVARLELNGLPSYSPGEMADDAAVLGALEFLTAFERKVRITGTANELWARLPDHDVRLGRPVDMAAKAASLTAVLDQGVVAGATIELLSAARPAVVPPLEVGSRDEVEVETSTETNPLP